MLTPLGSSKSQQVASKSVEVEASVAPYLQADLRGKTVFIAGIAGSDERMNKCLLFAFERERERWRVSTVCVCVVIAIVVSR